MVNLENLFDTEIVLENDRARLTPLKRSDFNKLAKIAYEDRIWKWGLSRLTTPEALLKYLNDALGERESRQAYPFLIFDKEMDSFAGSTRYGAISPPNKRLEIGWTWLHPDFHGSGLNKACKFELLRFAFEELKVNRVELKTDALNWQSRKAIKKLGATEEGIVRKHLITSTGRIRDSVYSSSLIEEWPPIKKSVFGEYCP
jgi:RimJ/RimL family protein N-acetyltransferase